MLSIKKIFFALVICFSLNNIIAQSSPDCVTAPTICGNFNIAFVSSSGMGSFVDYTTLTTISNPQSSPVGIVPPGGSGCHLAGELNPNFFIFTCQTAGTLEFDIASGPGVQMGCYDWVMWPYTAATCGGISGNTLPPTRCCWNAACSGGTGIASVANTPAGASANNFCAPVNVNCGDRFIVCISNYSGVNATVPIKFIGTAIISCISVGTPLAVNNATICSGGTATLIVTGGTGTATWTPGPSITNTLIVSPVVTTTYIATKPGGCGTGTIAAVVNVIPTPTITATNNSPVCAGSSFTLFGTGGGTYAWAGPAGYTSALQNPVIGAATAAMAGNYTLTVSNGICTKTAVTTVAVNPLPVIAPTNTGPYCPGATIQLNVGAFSTYTWTGPSAFNSNLQNPTQANAQAVNAGVYTVIVKSAAGCTNTANTTVVVNPSPVIVIGSNSPICAGSNLNLTSTGGGTYAWSGPNAFTSTLQNPTIPAATTLAAGNYTVTVTSVGGCTATAVINVVVGPAPGVTANNLGPICAGQTLSLTSTGAGPWTWTGPNAFSNATQNPTIPAATTLASGIYTVVAGVGTCTALATTNVVVNPLPVPAPTNTGPYCPGATIQLNVGAFSTYTWTGPSAFNSNLQNPTQANAQAVNAGVYTVIVKSAAGCTNTANTTVVVNPSPVIVIGSNSPICAGNPINLTSTGGGTYAWSGPNAFSSTLQNPTIPVSAAINAGNYSITVTSAAGCTSTAVVNVVVNTPTSTATNTGPYCAGQTIQLNTPAATTFTWTGPNVFTSNLQNPTIPAATAAMSGVYSVTAAVGTCISTATTNVVVNALPIPNAAATTPVCAGQAINLTGTGGGTYSWTGPNSFTSISATPSIPVSAITNAGNYILTVTAVNGCTATTNVIVVVNPLPTIVVSNPTTCVNTTILLTSNGGVTYSWTGPGGFTSTLQNPNIPSATIGMSGVYVVTVTDANGCVNTANANVSVLPVPNPNITSNSPVCAGQTLNLFGSGGATYSWSGPGYTGPTQNPVINNVTAAASGVYTLLVATGTCTASITYAVVINPIPVFNFTDTNVLCNGQSNGTSNVNVTVGTGPFTYQWNTIPVQTTQNVTALPAGTYSCIVTDANGCTNVASTNISQPTQFSVAINSATFSACAGSPINAIANGSGGTGPYTYNWVSGPSTNAYSINEALSGNYMYTVNATDAFNCPATANINLTFFPQPTVTATSATLCAGGSVNLTASGAQTYIWQPGNITGSTYPFTGNNTTNITVIGTANGCSNSANTSVMVNPNPNASISTGPVQGCVPTCLTFTGSGSASIVSYGWTLNGVGITGAQAGQYCFTDAATYSLGLSVMDSYGCTSSAPPVIINMYSHPVADFNHAPIKPVVNIDQDVTFTDASYGANIISWNWYFMNTAQYTSTLQNPTFSYTEPGTYVVALVVKSDKGCYDTLLRPIVVGEDFGIYVPNAFTPNGDGVNDVFQPKGFGVVKYEINIFDRWGEKMFRTTTFEEGWDGTIKGRTNKIIEEGTYTWLINCTDVFGKAHELKGHVILMK